MKKHRTKSIRMFAVLMILILLFTAITEAKRPAKAISAAPSADATGVSPSTQQAAAGKPANERYQIGTDVYDSLDEIKRDDGVDASIRTALTSAPSTIPAGVTKVFETPIGDVEQGTQMPSNPGFSMDETTGEFTQGSGAGKQVLKPDGLGNYEIFSGKDKVTTGAIIQALENNGEPKEGADAYFIQETDHAKNEITFRIGGTSTNPMPLNMYKELFIDKDERIKAVTPNADGSSSIETVSGGTFTIDTKPLVPKDNTGAGGAARSGAAGTDQGGIEDIQVTTATEQRGSVSTEHKQYDFGKTGITSENIDGNVVLNMQDGTKIYTDKKPGDEFEGEISKGIIPVKVQGKSYDYTMKHDPNGQVVLERNSAKEAIERADRMAIEAETEFKSLTTQREEVITTVNVAGKRSALEAAEKAVTDKLALLRTSNGAPKDTAASLAGFISLTLAEREALSAEREAVNSARIALEEAESAVAEAKRAQETAEKNLKSRNEAKNNAAHAVYEDGKIIPNPDGTSTELRYSVKDGKVVDFDSSITTDASGRVTAKVERTKADGWDAGKVDLGWLGKWGGNEGNQLKKTIYGADGKTYTQMSKEIANKDGTINDNFDPQSSGNFEANSRLINYDPDTGEIRSYPANFPVNDPRLDPQRPEYDAEYAQSQGTQIATKVGTQLGFAGVFGYVPDDVKKKIAESGATPEEQKAMLEEYKEGAKANAAERFESAQDYAQTFGKFSSLFADNGAFKQWSRWNDQWFNNWVLGGSDYRVSKVCEMKGNYLRKIGNNVLLVQTSKGQLVTAAFVNGERQKIETSVGGSLSYLYKISYKVNIPDSLIDKAETQTKFRLRATTDPKPEAPARILGPDPEHPGMRIEEFLAQGPFFNVAVYGSSGSRLCIYTDSGDDSCFDESVKTGANAIQRNMFVQYSANDYTKVCIEFTRSIEFANKISKSICADIVDVNEQPLNIVDVPVIPASYLPASQSGQGGSSSQPGSAASRSTTKSGKPAQNGKF